MGSKQKLLTMADMHFNYIFTGVLSLQGFFLRFVLNQVKIELNLDFVCLSSSSDAELQKLEINLKPKIFW